MSASASTPQRLAALDVWRGLIVMFMAVDHAAFFAGLHPWPEGLLLGATRLRPEFPSFIAWFTRFITHYCAPGFVFLAGASVVLLAASRSARGWSELAISGHLALRGALLIALEYTLVAWGWGAQVGGLFGVIACIGACLILGAVLRFLPGAAFAGLLLLFAHPLLVDPQLVPWVDDLPDTVRRILLVPEPMARSFASIYPVLPWLSLFLLGLGFGRAVVRNGERALRACLPVGALCLLLWLGIRLTDGFAAPVRAATADGLRALGTLTPYRPDKGWMDLFSMSKYPPAADFALWTLGGGLLFVWAVRRSGERRAWLPVRTFGRVPLFFYLAHLYAYRWLVGALVGDRAPLPTTFGSVWLVWAVGLIILWPLCWAFGRLKRRYPGFPLDLF